MVALMVEALCLSPRDRVLEVGTGSGYAAAVLSRLARQVVTVDRIPEFCANAARTLRELCLDNVSVHNAGEELGYKQDAPYDGVLVSAGAPHIPRSLLDQLAEGGRLVVPIGSRRQQELVRATDTPHGIELARIGPCAFVPLIGDDAWDSHSDSVGRPILP
jgi:protein-L-isoaspartate(D-aspartate) O-methyltransferase